MTLRRWLSTWWGRQVGLHEERATMAISSAQGPAREAPTAPAQFVELHTYLDRRYASAVTLSFQQMEDLLGYALPESARTEPTWWTADPVPSDRHADAWVAARRTATPHLSSGIVVFERLPGT